MNGYQNFTNQTNFVGMNLRQNSVETFQSCFIYQIHNQRDMIIGHLLIQVAFL